MYLLYEDISFNIIAIHLGLNSAISALKIFNTQNL